MNHNNRSILPMVFSVLVVLAFLLVMAQTVGAAPGREMLRFLRWNAPHAAEIFAPTDSLSGKVTMQYALPWKFDPIATPPPPAQGSSPLPNLGEFDLGIELQRIGNSASGYVNLTNSLVFVKVHTVSVNGSDLDVGPKVIGSFDGVNLDLLSEEFYVDKVPGDATAGKLKRQFRLVGTVQGNRLIAEYYEAISNYAPNDLTLVGSFVQAMPVIPPSMNLKTVYLPVMIRK